MTQTYMYGDLDGSLTDDWNIDDIDSLIEKLAHEDFECYVDSVIEWATEKEIFDKSNSLKQLEKTYEELGEVVHELNHTPQDPNNILLEFGDVLVTLVIAMEMNNIHPTDALKAAYEKISKRSGKMIDGKFVKDVAE
jgi:NTP pyrophosphatase (non-canonical NTP hydrolase)